MYDDDMEGPRKAYVIPVDFWDIPHERPAEMPPQEIVDTIKELAQRPGFGPARIKMSLGLRKVHLSQGEIAYLRAL